MRNIAFNMSSWYLRHDASALSDLTMSKSTELVAFLMLMISNGCGMARFRVSFDC